MFKRSVFWMSDMAIYPFVVDHGYIITFVIQTVNYFCNLKAG